MKENSRLQEYARAFIREMKLVFQNNISRFIGTPLQLHLMLEGSIKHFKVWSENALSKSLGFNYLKIDILKIFEKFINRKYDIYFKKMGVNESIPQEKDKYIFNKFSEDFAKSLILKTKPDDSLGRMQAAVLSVGVIKSNGSNTEFIHATFRDYFSAEVFINWIKKAPNVVSNESKRKYLLTEILKQPGFQLARTFINLKLKDIVETVLTKESLKTFGESIKDLLMKEKCPLTGEEGTALHIAVKESNINIVYFLLSSLKGQGDVMKQFLFTRDKRGKTALHLACRGNNIEIVNLLLDASAGISEHTLQEFLSCLDDNKWNALDEAVCKSKGGRILEEILKRTNNKLNLIINEEKKKSSLILACEDRKKEIFMTLVNEFKNDVISLKQLLLFKHVYASGNVLYYAALKFSSSIVEYLLCMAKSINDNDETIKKLLLPGTGNLPLNRAIKKGNRDVFLTILNVAETIEDDNNTMKQLLWESISQESTLLFTEDKQCDTMKVLLERAASLGNEVFEKFIFDLIKKNKNVMHAIFENGDLNLFADSFKILEEGKHQSTRKKIIEMYISTSLTEKLNFDKKRLIKAIRWNHRSKVKDILNRAKNSNNNSTETLRILLLTVDDENFRRNTLHVACLYRRTDIIKKLISYAIHINDEGKTLKELITSHNSSNETPFDPIGKRYANIIERIIQNLIIGAKKNNNERIADVLQEINFKSR